VPVLTSGESSLGLTELGPTAPPPRVRSASLLPVYSSHAMIHLAIGLYPAVLFALRTQWHQDWATLGAVYTAATMVYGFGALPVGLIIGRVRPLTLLRICVVGVAVSCLLVAVAPTSFWFAAALFALGASASLYHTAGLTLVSTVSGNDARLLGHHGMVGNVGLSAAPAFGGLLAWLVSWRLPFAVAGGLAFVLAGVLLFGARDLTRLTANDDPASGGAPPDPGRTHLRALVFVFAITIALGFIYRGTTTFLPSLAGLRTHFLPASDLVRGGVIASFVYAVGFFGQWAGGHLGGQRAAERLYTLLLGAQVVLLVLIFFASNWLLFGLLTVFSFVHFTTQPMDNTFTGKYTSLGRRGLGYGVSFGLSFGFGSLAAVAGGFVADAAGGRLQFVFLMLAGAAGAATLCGWGLQRVARTVRTARTTRASRTTRAPD